MFHHCNDHSLRKLIWVHFIIIVSFLAMTLNLVKVSYLHLLKYHAYVDSLFCSSEVDFGRGKIFHWMENIDLEQGLMEKATTHFRGMSNHSVSMCADAHFLPPQIHCQTSF